MTIAPHGTLDPSVHLYDTTLYAMSAALTLAVLSNALIRPVHPRHYLPAESGVGSGVGGSGVGKSMGSGVGSIVEEAEVIENSETEEKKMRKF